MAARRGKQPVPQQALFGAGIAPDRATPKPRAKTRPKPKRRDELLDVIQRLQLVSDVALLTALRAGPHPSAPLAWHEAGIADDQGLTRKGRRLLELIEDLAAALDHPL